MGRGKMPGIANVPITVDPNTGRWFTDGLPMLYVPAHFFLNNHLAIEEALGREEYSQLLYTAGYKSAWTWCEHEAKVHGIQDEELFRHYLRRLSERGWAQFSVLRFSLEEGQATVSSQHSVFAHEAHKESSDYMFTGWFAGAMDQILSRNHYNFRTQSRQVKGETQDPPSPGIFEISSIETD